MRRTSFGAIALAALAACRDGTKRPPIAESAPSLPSPAASSGASMAESAPSASAPFAAEAAAPAIADAAPPLAPLEAPDASDGTASLRIPGHGDAVVVLPIGTRRPRPILLALHGVWDRPEWECGAWNAVVHGRAFVLCPRGIPSAQATRDDPRLTFAFAEAMAKEVDDAVDALRAAYPAYVDAGPAFYTGFSLGAIYGVTAIAAAPARYPNAILVEGGHEAWTPARAAAFAKNGGGRVLFVCGSDDCPAPATRAMGRLAAAGVTTTRLHTVKGLGHTYGGAMFEDAREDIEWALAGDPRFGE